MSCFLPYHDLPELVKPKQVISDIRRRWTQLERSRIFSLCARVNDRWTRRRTGLSSISVCPTYSAGTRAYHMSHGCLPPAEAQVCYQGFSSTVLGGSKVAVDNCSHNRDTNGTITFATSFFLFRLQSEDTTLTRINIGERLLLIGETGSAPPAYPRY